MEQSCELFGNIRERGGASNFSKCAFVLVESKLSIPRVVTNMSLA